MKNYCFYLVLFALTTIGLSACNNHHKRYNAKTINPELIGKWSSVDGCSLTLMKKNESLVLVNYHDNKNHNLQNILLNFKLYSISTILTSTPQSGHKFTAKYIDGAIIIDNNCQPLQKSE